MRIPRNRRVDMTAPENQPKLIHAGDEWMDDGQPYLLIDDHGIHIVGGLNNGISIDKDNGTLLQGRLSFSEAPESISFCGGYFRLNPMVLSGVASSAAMPVPMLVNDQPQMLKAKKDLSGLMEGLL